MRYDRGGFIMRTGEVGRMNVLRQFYVLPGEMIRVSLDGKVELAALREQASVFSHARLDLFAQPLRWLDDTIGTMLKRNDLDATDVNLRTETLTPLQADGLGLGRVNSIPVFRFWRLAAENVFNWHFRWPEDPEISGVGNWAHPNTPELVNLERAFTRMQQEPTAAADRELAIENDKFDVRDLAQLQARFGRAMDQEWLAHDRYIPLLKELYGKAMGSREVDQTPMHIGSTSLNVQPVDLHATDGDSLGQQASFHDFGIGHSFNAFSAPEHFVLTLVFSVRFQPVLPGAAQYMAGPRGLSVGDVLGDPRYLAAKPPVPVTREQLYGDGGSSPLGFLPAGWHWRDGADSVDYRVRDRRSFPLLREESAPTATSFRRAALISDAFRSTALGHYLLTATIGASVDSPVPSSSSSLFSGTGKSVGGGSVYPMKAKVI